MSGRTGAGLERLVRDYAHRLWNEHDLSAIDDYVDDAKTRPDPRYPQSARTREQLKAGVARVLAVVHDHRLTVLDVVADGRLAVWSWEMTGRWTVRPGQEAPVRARGMTLYRFDGDHIVQRYGEGDVLSLAAQVGLMRPVTLGLPV